MTDWNIIYDFLMHDALTESNPYNYEMYLVYSLK